MAAHPGQILRDGFLGPLGVSPSRLAEGTGFDRSTISRVLGAKQPVTPLMAARLGAFFGVPARWFLLMQAEYDAGELAAHPELVRCVEPLPPDPDLLLTPAGAIRLDPPEEEEEEAGQVRTVVYGNGSVALPSAGS